MNEQFFTSLNGYKVKDEYAVHTYDSVANMKADSKLKEGMHVKTKGYYSANDGGSGEYEIIDDNTLIEDGGLYHETTNGLFAKLIINDKVNIKQFGAKGDGITDDTNSLKKAIEFATIIYIPKGKYVITDTIFIPSNKRLVGEKANTFFSGYNYGSTILYKNLNATEPCISFIGKDQQGNNHKDIYTVTGTQLDNGTYEQTVSSSIENINIVSEDLHNLAIAFSGCPTSRLEYVSIYGFIVGIISSACWNGLINKSFIKSHYGIIFKNNINNFSVNECYIDSTSKTYEISSDNTLLYNIVTNSNLYNQNIPCGIMAFFVYNLNISNTAIEHSNIGINLGAHSYANINNIWLEGNINPISTYSGNVNANRLYIVKDNESNEYAIEIRETKFKITSSYSTYDYLAKFYTSSRQYSSLIIDNVNDNNNYIEHFSSTNPDIIYVDSVNGSSNGIGLKKSPINDIETAINYLNDGGTIYLLNDYELPTNKSQYMTINKNLIIESDSSNKKKLYTRNAEGVNRIMPVRYLKNLTLKNVNIDIIIPSENASEKSLSYLFNPFNSSKKIITFENCNIYAKANYGLLGAYYNKNSYTEIVMNNCNFTGSCIMSSNRSSGSSTKLFVKEFINDTVFETTRIYESQTTVVETYEN